MRRVRCWRDLDGAVDIGIATAVFQGRRGGHRLRRKYRRPTIEWAKRMTGWGSVLAIEAQERIYYALAGNIALNNCFNSVPLPATILYKPTVIIFPFRVYL